MAATLKATVRYDGAGFAGWQVQPLQRTVQGVLQDTLSRIAGEPVHIRGAGRTDAGVHALGQVFSFHWPNDLSPGRMRHLSELIKKRGDQRRRPRIAKRQVEPRTFADVRKQNRD